ncbi:helix-turn-helix transcriptional regulator [Phocaeicola plebeius]|uniref:helix-turn-helix transcriptional regulator n=1 Tax=Phocaeicola plebeius TaxID=310297 RepID=UPI0026EEA321|nr:helix-turn-helix transcriptional regulator [Phocaeicola plebeius]
MGVKVYPNRIRVILAERSLTNRWLADQMGVTEITISRWTTNKVQPSMSQFIKMSQIFNIDLKDLVEPYEMDN